MKVKNQKHYGGRIHTSIYQNGQNAIFMHGLDGEPLAELSIMHDSIELEPDEFILKDFKENSTLISELLEIQVVVPTNRYVMIRRQLCPICTLRL